MERAEVVDVVTTVHDFHFFVFFSCYLYIFLFISTMIQEFSLEYSGTGPNVPQN